MKHRKTLVAGCAALLLGTISLTAFANEDILKNQKPSKDLGKITMANNNKNFNGIGGLNVWSGEDGFPQTVEGEDYDGLPHTFKHSGFANSENWDNLTDAEKDELYSLQDKMLDVQLEIIDKKLELGLIDQETADFMKERLTEENSLMRENGFMPMDGIGGGRIIRGGMPRFDFDFNAEDFPDGECPIITFRNPDFDFDFPEGFKDGFPDFSEFEFDGKEHFYSKKFSEDNGETQTFENNGSFMGFPKFAQNNAPEVTA